MGRWTKDQESYQLIMNQELLELKETRSTVTSLNEQMNLLILHNRKAKKNQDNLKREVKEALETLKKLRMERTIDDLGLMNEGESTQVNKGLSTKTSPKPRSDYLKQNQFSTFNKNRHNDSLYEEGG